MLPDNDWVFVEIADVGTANSLWVLLHQHPAEVTVEQPLPHGVWIFVSIGVAMVCSVVTSP